MKITILGSGTSTGVPMVGCFCPVCTSDDPRDRRTRASLLIEFRGKFILVDTSTDLRGQMIRERVPCIDAVLFTHSHADHVHGIDDLRGFHFIHKRIVPGFGDAETMAAIAAKFPYIFKGLEVEGYTPLLELNVIDSPFDLFGLGMVPVPLMHGSSGSTGYRFGGIAYLTDLSGIPDSSMGQLSGLEVLIIDALRYTPHDNHLNIDGALEVVRQLRPGRTLLTHLTHEVAHADGGKLPPGVELAYDGLTLVM